MTHRRKSAPAFGMGGHARGDWRLLARQLGLGALWLSLLCTPQCLAAAWAGPGTLPSVWALPVEIKTAPAFDAVVFPMHGSFAQHDAAIARLRAELRSAGVEPIGPIFGRYLNDPAQVSEQDLQWEVGYPVPHGTRVVRPFELRSFEAQLVASLRLHGPYAESARSSPALFEWLAKNSYYANGDSFAFWSVVSTPDGLYTPETELRVPVGRVRVLPLLFRYLVCIWGAYVFALFSVVYLRQRRRRRVSLWAGHLWALLGIACAVLYLLPLVAELLYLYAPLSERRFVILDEWSGTAGIVIPPLLAHLFFRVTRSDLPKPLLFQLGVIAMYAVGGTLAFSTWFIGFPAVWTDTAGQVGDGFVAVAAALGLTMVMLCHAKGTITRPERQAYVTLLAAAIAVSLLSVVFAGSYAGGFLEPLLRAMPIPLFFATMYYNERAVFFDIVAKRGLFTLAMLILLMSYFALVPSWLWSIRLGWLGSWVFPLSALPLVIVAPGLYGRLSSYLDRRWLGRNLSPAEAHQFFLGGLATATTEESLVAAAEQRLAAIYRAAARVTLGPGADSMAGTESFEAPIVSRGERQGSVRVETPAGGRPFLSEDRQLLISLADSLALALENVRLREKELRQERREHDLLLHASRAELKSLRAQINPHFLFNALNSIAALIAIEPEQAELTVERLAELFRYALRRSDKEWVHVEDEMAFVQCYLDVEETRFHKRLKVCVEQDETACKALVPVMMVHTLVENAVKHGIAAMRGAGMIEVRVSRQDGALRIEVRDSGPGFADGGTGALNTPGHGLKNVQDRLRAHFGEDGRLTFGRDEGASMTTVSIAMPFLLVPPGELRGASR
jgi:effector-binding domain-containing protein/signal transduction histidine kinase